MEKIIKEMWKRMFFATGLLLGLSLFVFLIGIILSELGTSINTLALILNVLLIISPIALFLLYFHKYPLHETIAKTPKEILIIAKFMRNSFLIVSCLFLFLILLFSQVGLYSFLVPFLIMTGFAILFIIKVHKLEKRIGRN